jgi:DNA-binding NtrC family response regulator
MTRVVVVDFDEALRGVLHDILAVDGPYDVRDVSEHTAAVDYLANAPEGVIAVCSNRDAHHQRSAAFFAAVAADEQLATRHQYLMLSTNPREMPASLQANLTHLQATILAKPFELDALLAAVRKAEGRLVAVPAPVRDTHHED